MGRRIARPARNKNKTEEIEVKIAVIGTGYVGLPTGVGFAELGHDVVCIDKAEQKIADLNDGEITLFEDGLEELFNKNRSNGKIKFTTDMKSGIEGAEYSLSTMTLPTS
jgi:UDPglucose 6-dehydrogenase